MALRALAASTVFLLQPLWLAASDVSLLHLKPRYYNWVVEPGKPWVETNTGYAFVDWKIPLSQSALILLDVWEGMYLADTAERNDRITREIIAPLIRAAREKGMTIIHCPGPRYGREHPNLLRYPNLVDLPNAAIDPAWPPPGFRDREGEYAAYAKPPMPKERAREMDAYQAANRIHPAVAPAAGEPVILTGRELHQYLKENKLLFLFFAGFQTNACLFTRDYSAWEMHKKGYTVTVLRDCGTAMESFETADDFAQTTNAILMLEMFGKYSLSSQEMRDALEKL